MTARAGVRRAPGSVSVPAILRPASGAPDAHGSVSGTSAACVRCGSAHDAVGANTGARGQAGRALPHRMSDESSDGVGQVGRHMRGPDKPRRESRQGHTALFSRSPCDGAPHAESGAQVRGQDARVMTSPSGVLLSECSVVSISFVQRECFSVTARRPKPHDPAGRGAVTRHRVANGR